MQLCIADVYPVKAILVNLYIYGMSSDDDIPKPDGKSSVTGDYIEIFRDR